MGIQEIIVILVIVVLLFGTPVLTFLLGYLVGRRRAHEIVCDEDLTPSVSGSEPVVSNEEPEDE